VNGPCAKLLETSILSKEKGDSGMSEEKSPTQRPLNIAKISRELHGLTKAGDAMTKAGDLGFYSCLRHDLS
jgi:hypothetical protein